MDFRLESRVVLVTGGSGDIGAAIAATFAREGAKVAVGWRTRPERADELVAAIRGSGGSALGVQLDQGDSESISHAVAAVEHALGEVDVLVGNAVSWPVREQTWDSLVHGLTVNVAGTVMLTEAALTGMRARR